MKYEIRPCFECATLADVEKVSGWNRAEEASIESYPWTPEIRKPVTKCRVLYRPDTIFLRFDVEEDSLHTTHIGHQSEVWKDNCVEWFVRPGKGPQVPYFNFEFNCLGYILLACGRERSVRQPVPLEEISRIVCRTTHHEPVIDEGGSPKKWFLEAAIPVSILLDRAEGASPAPGVVWQGNFNKCSESTRIQHWGTWNPVGTADPDFHRPEFFGDLVFG